MTKRTTSRACQAYPLPRMNLADLSIFPATQAQIQVQRDRTWENWGRGLSRDEYSKRDAAFENLPHAADSKYVVWILSTRENHSQNLDFFASCETFQREVAISKSTPKTDSPGPLIGYGIASVFTAERHRGKGYAKHMMRLLHYVLGKSNRLPSFPIEHWGQPPLIPQGFGMGEVSVLYSDIGPDFYRLCGKGLQRDNGWTVRQPIGTVWTVPPSAGREGDLSSKVEWLTDVTQQAVWEHDAVLIREEIVTSSTLCFAYLPDQGVANDLLARSHFYSPQMSTEGIWGAKLLEGSEGQRLCFATWALDSGREGSQTLLITRLRSTPKEFPTLLQAAFKAARSFGLEQVEVWNLDPSLSQVGEEELGGRTGTRDGPLPSLAWYGEGNESTLAWKYNEIFCWS